MKSRTFLVSSQLSRLFDRTESRSLLEKMTLATDVVICFLRYGASADDYARYEFGKIRAGQRKTFITYRKSQALIRRLNPSASQELLYDKAAFNRFFTQYVHRDWIDLRHSSRKDVEQFLERMSTLGRGYVIKPISGGQGIGIHAVRAEEAKARQAGVHAGSPVMLEEYIVQHPALAALHSSSVNTIRVQTLRDSRGARVIAATLRIGAGGGAVDNLHSGGICVSVDLETGVLFTLGVNNELKRFLRHPNTGMILPGFSIPEWPKVKALTIAAAEKLEGVGWVGWDVAVLENGDVELVEGNHDPGHDVIQMVDLVGKASLLGPR